MLGLAVNFWPGSCGLFVSYKVVYVAIELCIWALGLITFARFNLIYSILDTIE